MYALCVFFRQKTAYEMRISDWSSDVCSSDLHAGDGQQRSPDGAEVPPLVVVPSPQQWHSLADRLVPQGDVTYRAPEMVPRLHDVGPVLLDVQVVGVPVAVLEAALRHDRAHHRIRVPHDAQHGRVWRQSVEEIGRA